MIIANIDAFKTWVQKKVSPITDADPATLARYVAALVKKDKSEAVIRETCLQELNIFLLDNTKSFVEALFLALSTLSYLTDQVAPDSTVADSGLLKQPTDPPKDAPLRSITEHIVPEKGSTGDDKKADYSSVKDSFSTEISRSRRSSSKEERSRHVSSQQMYSSSRADRSPVFSRLGHRQRSPDRRHHETTRRSGSRERSNRHPTNDDRSNNLRGSGRRLRESSRSPRLRARERLGARSQALRSRSPHFKPRERSRSRSCLLRSRSPHLHSKSRERSSSRSRGLHLRSKPRERSTSRSRFVRSRSKPRERSSSRSGVMRSRSKPRERSTSRSRILRSPSPRSKPREHSISPSAQLGEHSMLLSAGKSPPHVISVVSSVLRMAGMANEGETPLEDVERSPSSDGRDESDYRITVPLDAMNDLRRLPPLASETATNHHTAIWSTPQLVVKPRCQDFDEKGFCVRGDLCPFDHGLDPLVVDDVPLMTPPPPLPFPVACDQRPVAVSALSHSLPLITPSQAPINLPVCTASRQDIPRVGILQAATQPLFLASPISSLSAASTLPGTQQLLSSAYEPLQPYVQRPFIHHAAPSRHTYYMERPSLMAQSLSSLSRQVPPCAALPANSAQLLVTHRDNVVVDARRVIETKQQPSSELAGNDIMAASTRKVFDHGRLGVRVIDSSADSASSSRMSLILNNIPPALNTISNINEHFTKFGTVVNVQVCYNGLPSSALVTFASCVEAKDAYECKEPVFNNRFITLDWQTAATPSGLDIQQSAVGSGQLPLLQRLSAKERLGALVVADPLPRLVLFTGDSGSREVAPLRSVHDRLGSPPVSAASSLDSSSKSVVLSTTGVISKTVQNSNKMFVTRKPAVSSLPGGSNATQESSKKLQKDAAKVKLDLLRQKQMLMMKQIDKQKGLLVLLENPLLTSADKTAALKMLKTLIASVEKLKSELSSSAASFQQQQQQNQQQQQQGTTGHQQNASSERQPVTQAIPNVLPAAPPANTVSLPLSLINEDPLKAKRLVLDAELELIAKQNKGDSDVGELDRRISVLKYQASSLGLFAPVLPPPNRCRGGMALSTWSHGRGGGPRNKWYLKKPAAAPLPPPPSKYKHRLSAVDHRPKDVVVSGFTNTDRAAVIEHFKNLGGSPAVDSEKVVDVNESSILLSFKTRQQAEHAMNQAANFNGKWLKLMWHQTQPQQLHHMAHNVDVSENYRLADETTELSGGAGSSSIIEDEEQQVVVVHVAGAEGEDDDAELDALIVEQSHSSQQQENLYEISSENEFDEDALLGTNEDDGVILD